MSGRRRPGGAGGHSDPEEHAHDHHDHVHTHPGGLKGFLHGLLVPHTHDAADSIDDALESSVQGVRALRISLLILLGTTILQFAVFLASGSVALLADTVHNFADALTAVPLWIAFVLGRRVATRRYTYGFGRAEDLAGLVIVLVVALSAVVAAWESVGRLLRPQVLDNLWLVALAGLIGFVGNEIVAVYRIRVGRRIGSAALVADGVHARLDGFTSLAVVLGAVGALLGFPLADPIVGIVISAAIVVLLWGTVRSIGRRLMDGIDPGLADRARQALDETPGVLAVPRLQLRWVGHRLQGAAVVEVADAPVSVVQRTLELAERNVGRAVPHLDELAIRPVASPAVGEPRLLG
ncbi:cation diffusion facilitator family transporter [Frigoribacterium faeni]|uniref:Cation diffusion facilitator family transporter n=1 Tax=Frigoribacterium faeni TaxID=145483 RepID=A0A7W3JFT2_9MICO|nr:cation diffusion facilitator family transporter [Frigoribacterium faeni]MBA8812011.1 cation diffusion facilitator family transporter [Frigoribacterium faeni]GEK83989.1 Co/Zn/Cd cation transporter [Frigoribacterium faeni]